MPNGTWNVDAGGNWSTSTNWLSNQIADGATFTANFTNNITAARTVTLDTTRTIGSLTFSDAGAAGSAWTLTRSSTNTLTLNNGASAPVISVLTPTTISVPLAGTNGFTKAGANNQSLVFSASNTVSGTFTLSNGYIDCGSRAAGGVDSNVFSNIDAFHLASGTIYYISQNTVAGYSFKAGSTFTGDGQVHVTAATGAGVSAANTINFRNMTGYPGLMILWSNDAAGNLSRDTNISYQQFPTTGLAWYYHTFSANATTVKYFYIPTDAVGHTTGMAIELTAAPSVPSATLTANYRLIANQPNGGTGMNFTGNVSRRDLATFNQASVTFTLAGTNTDANTISGRIYTQAGNALAMEKLDVGRWVFSNATNSYAGGTIVGGGFLRGTNNAAFGTGTVTINSGTVELSGGITVGNVMTLNTDPGSVGAVQSISGTNVLSGNVTAASSGVTASVGADTSQTLRLSGNVIGAGNFVTRGAGTVELTGANNSFSGVFIALSNITSVININPSSGSLGTNVGAVSLGNYAVGLGGTLKYIGTVETANTRGLQIIRDGSQAATTYTLDNSGTSTGRPGFNPGTFTYRDSWTAGNDVTLRFAGTQTAATAYFGLPVADPSGGAKLNIVKDGDAPWRIFGNTTNTGTTEVNAGTLIGDHDSATPSARFGGGNVRLNAGGTLKTLTGTSQLGRMSYASGLKLNGGTLQIGGTA